MRTAVILVTLLVLPLPAFAGQNQHVVDQSVLDEAIAERVRQAADDREAIQRVLKNERVRKIAADVGVDLERAGAAVATLDYDDMAVMAAQARAVNDALAGGQSNVTISTTVIIIGLLVLILLIVAL
jgi:hypothetical protein